MKPTREATVAFAPAAPTPSCTFCGGLVETLGVGRAKVQVTRCSSCGREPTSPRSEAAGRAAPGSTPTGRKCQVPGCPGVLGPSGTCRCCELRAEWLLANMPKRECVICVGVIVGGRSSQHCAACKPIALRAKKAKEKRTALKS